MIKKIIRNSLLKFGYEIKKINKYQKKFKKLELKNKKETNLNIGSGGIDLPNFINLDYSSDWYKNSQNKHKFIEYNIIKDDLPFEESTIDNIYISHVVEHLEDEHVKKLIKNCIKVLKKNHTLRIATPDSKFLYDATENKNNFWDWRHQRLYKMKYIPEKLDSINFLVREVSTPKLKDSIENLSIYKKEFAQGYENFMNFICKNNYFDEHNAGYHINWWSFKKFVKIFRFLEEGDKDLVPGKIILSKPGGSVSKSMRNKYFDTQVPFITLYVEYIKN